MLLTALIIMLLQSLWQLLIIRFIIHKNEKVHQVKCTKQVDLCTTIKYIIKHN